VAKLRKKDVPDWLVEHGGRISEIVAQPSGDGLTSELMQELMGDKSWPLRHKLVPWGGAELVAGYRRGMEALQAGMVRTVRDPDLDLCPPRAAWKDLAGGQVLDDKKAKCDMAPLKAWFGAYGMRTRAKPQPRAVRIMPQLLRA